jgi:putative transposase
MEKRSIKIRLYPTRGQETLIIKSLGADRWVFNRGLYLKRKRYEEFKENLSWIEISKMVTFWKKTEELSWLKEPSRSVLDHSLKKLDMAFNNFFKNGKDTLSLRKNQTITHLYFQTLRKLFLIIISNYLS